MGKKNKSDKKKAPTPSLSVSHSSSSSVSDVPQRQRLMAIQQQFSLASTEQKIAMMRETMDLFTAYHGAGAPPDKNIYLLVIKLSIDFCHAVPNHYIHVPELYKVVLQIIDITKDIDMPEIEKIYNFAMSLIHDHIKRSIEGFLQTSAGHESLLELEFEQIFAIFQQFIGTLNDRKRRNGNIVLHQQELNIYNKFVFILTISSTMSKLPNPELNALQRAISIRMLTKVFHQAEAANLSLSWTSYHHIALTISCTSNPNLSILLKCFDRLKALGFFEPMIDSEERSSQPEKNTIQKSFCLQFFQGLQRVLAYDSASGTSHFTVHDLQKVLKMIEYLCDRGFLETIYPCVFDILAHAPYHPNMDPCFKYYFRPEYPYTSQDWVSIFQGLSRAQVPDPQEVRFFVDDVITQQWISSTDPDTHLILFYLCKIVNKLSEPDPEEVLYYLQTVIALKHDNPDSFARIVQVLGRIKPSIDEEKLYRVWDKILSLPCFAISHTYPADVIENMLCYLEQLPIPNAHVVQSLFAYSNCREQMTCDLSWRIIRLSARCGDGVTSGVAVQTVSLIPTSIQLENLWKDIKSKEIDKLERANKCLNQILQQATTQHPDYLVAKIQCVINLGHYDTAMVWLGYAKVACEGKNERSLRISFAICCKKLGQFSTAIRLREQIRDELLTGNPHHRLTLVQLVNTLELAHCHILAEGDEHYHSALTIYTALKMQVQHLSAQHVLEIDVRIAECYIKLNQFTAAERQLHAIVEGKDSPKVLLMFAWLYQAQNQKERATSIYQTLLQRKDNPETIWRALYQYCYRLPPKERALVRQHMSQILEQAPFHTAVQSKALLRDKVMILMQKNRYQEALEILNQMYAIWGKDESIYIGLTICYRHFQKLDRAIAMLLQFPGYQNNRKILMQLIACYQLQQDESKLLACFDLLLTRFQSYALGISKAILYYHQHGQREKLKQAWEQALQHCHENVIFQEMAHWVQPYLEDAPLSISQLEQLEAPAMLTNLELEDVFYSPDTLLREEEDIEDTRHQQVLYQPVQDSFSHQGAKELDLARRSGPTIFKQQRDIAAVLDLETSNRSLNRRRGQVCG